MKLKKINLLVLLFLIIFLVTGCGTNEVEEDTSVNGTTTSKVTIVDEDFNENGSGTLNCVQEAVAGEGIDVELKYTVTYSRGNILVLRSISRVISNDAETVTLYEDAYKNIAKNYSSLKYYDTNIIRDSNSVTYDATINYDKIDIDKLLDIEGEEDNIIKNGKAKLSLWLDLAEQVGTTCEEA